jgi:hypothetical protein
MAVDLICPDCGGVIGTTGASSDGRAPCSCFKDDPGKRTDPSDTVSIPTPQQGNDTADLVEKLCIVCGKNVAGHRRIKDSRGYLCYQCARDEMREERAGTVPCAECGRRVKEAGLVEYSGLKICRKCFQDHKETQRKVVKRVSTHHFDLHEKQGLLIVLAIFIILGLIVLWRQLM